MATKVIKLKENNNTLIPVTDAKIVQMTYDGTTYSVHDVILDTEEAIATTYNHLSARIENLEYYVDNPPLLNTDNSNSLTPMSAEEIDGTINLHKVAKTGSWNDLNDTPDIPAAPVKSNWNETNSSSLAYILNKPTIPAAPGTLNTNNTASQSVSSSESLSGNINLHRISKTGNYNDLTHYPYETKVLVSKHINTVGSTIITVPAGNFMISCTATGSTASFNITAEKSGDIWEWSTTDGKIFAEYEYVFDSSGVMTITVSGTPANDTDIVLTIYDVINGTGDYSSQLGLNGYIEGKRISRVGQVAVTNDYNDLINKPTIPAAANNGRLTIQKNGTNVQTFTANQSTNVTANIRVAEPIIIEVTGDGTQGSPYTAQGSPYTTITTAIDSLSNIAIWVKHNEEYYSFVKGDTSNNIATFIHTSGDGTIKKFTVDDNDDITFSTFKSSKIENYGDDATINNLTPSTDGDFAYSEDSGDLYYGDQSNYGAYKRILTDDNISTTLKTVNSTPLIGSGNIDAEDVILGKIVKESANPHIPAIKVDRFYKFLGTFTSSGGTFHVLTPDYSSTAETGNVNKIYVDITTKKAYWYDSSVSINGNTNSGAFVELCQTDLSNYYTKSEIDDSISNAKTTKFGYLNSSGDFYEAYWSTLTDTTTSYYLPAVNQNTLSYTNNLYIDINTGKNYRYKNGTLGTGETRFEEIKPCIAKEKIVRTDRKAFMASTGTAINMESKYFYVFGSLYYDEVAGEYSKLITRLEIASLVNSYDDDKYENDFHAMVYCGSSTSDKMYFSLPEGIRIANDVTLPDLEQGYLFEFHILNGILTFTYTKLINP